MMTWLHSRVSQAFIFNLLFSNLSIHSLYFPESDPGEENYQLSPPELEVPESSAFYFPSPSSLWSGPDPSEVNYQLSPFKLEEDGNDMQMGDDFESTYNNEEVYSSEQEVKRNSRLVDHYPKSTYSGAEKSEKYTAKMKVVHYHNVQYHKKEHFKKLAERANQVSNTNSTTQADCRSQKNKPLFSRPSKYTSILKATSKCGPAKPSSSITVTAGPNGCESFLNCGITGDGWDPPHVTMSMLRVTSLNKEPAKTTFAPCKKYYHLFKKYGKKYNIPPIFLAAFAMQESSCDPNVVGDQGGAFGLMQITKDKCGNAPGGNCADPDFNVGMGAKTFADGLAEADGNVLKAIGGYNGWTVGLTKSQALKAKDEGCCVCQQNLDYLHQYLNGWALGIDPISRKLGTMRNLDVCSEKH